MLECNTGMTIYINHKTYFYPTTQSRRTDSLAGKVAQEHHEEDEQLRKLEEAVKNLHTMADDACGNLPCVEISCADCPANLVNGGCGFVRVAEMLESCKCMTNKRSESDE